MAHFSNRLQVSSIPVIALEDLLQDLPGNCASLARQIWKRRGEFDLWLAAEPGRAQRLISEPEKVVTEVFPEISLPSGLPGSTLQKAILERVPLRRVHHDLEVQDPKVVDSMALFSRLLERVVSGATTRERIAAEPEAEIQAAAPGGTPAEIIDRVAFSVRFVLGLPQQIAIPDQGVIHFPVEALLGD